MQNKQAINYQIVKIKIKNMGDIESIEKEVNKQIYDSWEPAGSLVFVTDNNANVTFALQSMVQYRYHY